MPAKVTVTGTINLNGKELTTEQRIYLVKEYLYHERGKTETISSIVPAGGILHIPRNFKKFLQKCNDLGIPAPLFKDERLTVPFDKPFSLNKTFSLREYQKGPVKNLLLTLRDSVDHACILKAAPSFGKSFILPFVLKQLKQKALILVDRTNLRDQMKEEFDKNAKGWVQVIDSNTTEVADVNIATFQALLKNPALINKLSKRIGIVIVDECHLISIGAFTNIVNIMPAKYRLGLSATPTRSDGLTQALYDVMSKNIIEGANPNLLGVKFIFVKTPFSRFDPMVSIQRRWISFYSNPQFAWIVIRTAIALTKIGRKVMIYSTHQEVQKLLASMITDQSNFKVGLVNAKTIAEAKIATFKAFNEGKIDILITGVTTQKGVSIHNLDTILNYANHNKESYEQLVGRLRRDSKTKKKPMFIDFMTEGIGLEKSIDRVYYAERQMKPNDDKLFWSLDKFSRTVLGDNA